MGIEPVLLCFGKEVGIDEIPTIRHHGNVLKTQIRLVAKGVTGLNFLDHGKVFNSDAKNTILVEARLNGHHIAWS